MKNQLPPPQNRYIGKRKKESEYLKCTDPWGSSKRMTIWATGIQEGEERKKSREFILQRVTHNQTSKVKEKILKATRKKGTNSR